LICLFLIIVTLAVYLAGTNYDFVNFDDDVYVTENRHVQEGLTLKGITWAFTEFSPTYWHPLTWLSHMLDCELYGLEPGMHHLTNLLFHIVNTLLLFLVFQKNDRQLMAERLCCSPVRITSNKCGYSCLGGGTENVLSTFLWILTMFTYARYIEKPGLFRYMLTFSVLPWPDGQPMLVTLPFVLFCWTIGPSGVFVLVKATAIIEEKPANLQHPIIPNHPSFDWSLKKHPFSCL